MLDDFECLWSSGYRWQGGMNIASAAELAELYT